MSHFSATLRITNAGNLLAVTAFTAKFLIDLSNVFTGAAHSMEITVSKKKRAINGFKFKRLKQNDRKNALRMDNLSNYIIDLMSTGVGLGNPNKRRYIWRSAIPYVTGSRAISLYSKFTGMQSEMNLDRAYT